MILTIKRRWLDMIRAGEKKEEYRGIKPYYSSRFKKFIGLEFVPVDTKAVENVIRKATEEGKEIRVLHSEEIAKGKGAVFDGVVLRAGYSLLSPAIEIGGHITIGPGRPEWGAEKGKNYFILHIEKMEELLT